MQSLTIYINNRPLILTDYSLPLPYSVVEYRKDTDLLHYIKLLEQLEINGLIIYSADFNLLSKQLFSLYKVQTACGGLVFNPKGEILAIFRRGFWDLPKGKTEAGETLEETAVREVMEETGLRKVDLQQFICTTYHSFFQLNKNRRVLKISHWYQMNSSDTALFPQTEEDIELATWIELNEFGQKQPIYENIKAVIQPFLS